MAYYKNLEKRIIDLEEHISRIEARLNSLENKRKVVICSTPKGDNIFEYFFNEKDVVDIGVNTLNDIKTLHTDKKYPTEKPKKSFIDSVLEKLNKD